MRQAVSMQHRQMGSLAREIERLIDREEPDVGALTQARWALMRAMLGHVLSLDLVVRQQSTSEAANSARLDRIKREGDRICAELRAQIARPFWTTASDWGLHRTAETDMLRRLTAYLTLIDRELLPLIDKEIRERSPAIALLQERPDVPTIVRH